MPYADYGQAGYTILRGAIPPSLLADLRREAEKAPPLARGRYGPQAQRLQPVSAFAELDLRPFNDFEQLPVIQECATALLGPERTPCPELGILLQPGERKWCTNWHRDWRRCVRHQEDLDLYESMQADVTTFNQINAALYDDDCFWVVPGSHSRADLDAERLLHYPLEGPAAGSEPDDYVRAMPGAVQLRLQPGDVAFYRRCALHLGAYSPAQQRATLHAAFLTPADLEFERHFEPVRQQLNRDGHRYTAFAAQHRLC